MFMRLFQLSVKPEALELSRTYYDSTVVPRLHAVKGCLFARLIKKPTTWAGNEPTELISMTLWENKEYAEAYRDSPVFHQLMKEFEPYLAESTEWKVQLSEKGELEYKPEVEEPLIRAFPVSTRESLKQPVSTGVSPRYVRLVSVKLQKGKLKEFKRLYKAKIIPALQETKGCLYAYLMENLQEGEAIISVTIWENRQAAVEYENSGKFNALVEKVKHTFSRLYQWKMSLVKESGREAQTSDDMKVDHYEIVSGQEF